MAILAIGAKHRFPFVTALFETEEAGEKVAAQLSGDPDAALRAFRRRAKGFGTPQIVMTVLDEHFSSLQPSNGQGFEHELYLVNDDDSLSPIAMKFGLDVVYPPRHPFPGGDYPDDVHEAGETISEALDRLDREAVLNLKYLKYVVLRTRAFEVNEILLAARPEQLAHDIRVTAYELWEGRGRPFGDGLADWVGAMKALEIPYYLQHGTSNGYVLYGHRRQSPASSG